MATASTSGRKHSLNLKLFKQNDENNTNKDKDHQQQRPLEYLSSSASSTSTNLPQINTTAPPSLPIRRKSFKLNAKSNRFRRSPSELRANSPQSHSQTSYETDDCDHLSSDDSAYSQSQSRYSSSLPSESSDYDYDINVQGNSDDDDDNDDVPPHNDLLPSVPLKPFKNQVGGHNPIFRFSRRAVCKPLVRRENQFYESVERDHPRLLQYIPQYLGVLNVTFVKSCSSPTPEAVEKLSELGIAEERGDQDTLLGEYVDAHTPSDTTLQQPHSRSHNSDAHRPSLGRSHSSVPLVNKRGSGREFSRSLEHHRTGSEDEIPQVKFERNTHLIPNWMLRRSGLNHHQTHQDRRSLAVMSEDETSPQTNKVGKVHRGKAHLHRKTSLPSTHSRVREEQEQEQEQEDEGEDDGISKGASTANKMNSSMSMSNLQGQLTHLGHRSQRAPQKELSLQAGIISHTPSPSSSITVTPINTPSHREASQNSHYMYNTQNNLTNFNTLNTLPKSQSDTYPTFFGGRGATTVNRRLQEQVLREVFSSSPRILNRRKRRSRKSVAGEEEESFARRHVGSQPSSYREETGIRARSRSQEPQMHSQRNRRVSVGSEMEQQVLLRLRSECAEECALKAKSFLTNRVDNDDDDSDDDDDSESGGESTKSGSSGKSNRSAGSVGSDNPSNNSSISDHTDMPSGRTIRKRRSHFLLSVDENAQRGERDVDVFAMEELTGTEFPDLNVDGERRASKSFHPTTSFKLTTTTPSTPAIQQHKRSRSRSVNGSERSLESSNVFSQGMAEAKSPSPQAQHHHQHLNIGHRGTRPSLDVTSSQSSPIYHSAEILPKASNTATSTPGNGIDVRGSSTAMTASIREKNEGKSASKDADETKKERESKESNGGSSGSVHKADIPDTQVITQPQSDSRLEQFLLMEDLTGRLKAPCVLDLKMGTRQYGVDATEEKKASQRKKAKKTTSHSLGLRLCGTQVYNVRRKEYTFQDKYYGRNVQPGNFTHALSAFLDNGEGILVHHIPDILVKLYKLARIISSLNGYRFYASSLLFLYDGDAAIQSSLADSFNKHGSIKASSNRRRKGEINIKIIDFAHCTTGKDFLAPLASGVGSDLPRIKEGGYNAKVDRVSGLPYARYPPKHPNEPDYGYLIGLRNLCKSFREIWEWVKENGRDDLGKLSVADEHVFEEIFANDKDYQSN